MKRRIILVICVLPLLLLASCATSHEPTSQPPESARWPKFTVGMYAPSWGEKTRLEEVPSILGMTDVTVPVPSYLPENCEIKEVYLGEVKYRKHGAIRLVISDEAVKHQGEECECVLLMYARWMLLGPAGGLKMPWASPIDIEGAWVARLDKTDDPVALWMQLPQFEIVLMASKDFPDKELIKIAESALD